VQALYSVRMTNTTDPPAAVELAVIINSFNRRNLLEKAVSALAASLRRLPFESAIFVFEAGSTDGSREWLEQWMRANPNRRVDIIQAAEGAATTFGAGVNAACAMALKKHETLRWLLLYETDNWIAEPEPLLKARELLETQSDLAAVGFTVRLHSGTRCGFGVPFPSVLGLVVGQQLSVRWKLDFPPKAQRRQSGDVKWFYCDAVFTSPILVRREAWVVSKGIDAEAFPFSDSDVDWAWRCARLGWRMAVIESDAVVHDNLAVASAWSANRVIDFHRSRLRLLKRHRGKWVNLIKPFLFARHLVESILLARRARLNPAARTKLEKRREMCRSVWRNYEP
jgi:GT2 family glycosyltransferase